MLIPVILAGGSGTRFWPVARRAAPKFCLRPEGGAETASMLAATFVRLKLVTDANHIHVVTGADQARQVRDELPVLPDENLLIEPEPRNTAAAVAYATAVVRARYGSDAAIAILPADHVIDPASALCEGLDAAKVIARELGSIVTFGIPPTRPSTSYGYIQLGAERPGTNRGDLFDVDAFVEKPDRAKAERFLAAGNYLWNAGIFVFTSDTMYVALETFLPEHREAAARIERAWSEGDAVARKSVVADCYSRLESTSLDYGVMERTSRVVCARAQFSWDDLGTFDSLDAFRRSRDADGDAGANLLDGDVLALDSEGCLVQADEGLVAVVGMRDVIVVRHKGAVLVLPRGASDKVRDVVARLEKDSRDEWL